jgi:hypothetical protein
MKTAAIVLFVIQGIGIIGSISMGSRIFYFDTSSLSAFLLTVLGNLAYMIFAIIGAICLISHLQRKKWDKEEAEKSAK